MARSGCNHPLRLCQFNVLAPSARICAPLDRIPWRERHNAVCDAIGSLTPSIVTLQEFDFAPATAGFAQLYQDKLGEDFHIFTKQRTGRKLDGLALLVRRSDFDEVSVDSFDLEPRSCDRVCMVGRMRHKASGRRIAVLNTHLTVAHASNGHDIPRCRPLQMEQVLDCALRQQADSAAVRADAVFIGADLNCDHLEEEASVSGKRSYTPAEVSRPVHMAFETGFRSAFHDALDASASENGGSADGGRRPISHTCSYAQDGCCDYIMWRDADEHGHCLQTVGAYLYPREIPPSVQWDSARGWWGAPDAAALETDSDADPDASCAAVNAMTLSDHRPLVADFRLLSSPATVSDGAAAVGSVAAAADTFAIYLRPAVLEPDSGGNAATAADTAATAAAAAAAAAIAAADASQERWGGLHITLCSFALVGATAAAAAAGAAADAAAAGS